MNFFSMNDETKKLINEKKTLYHDLLLERIEILKEFDKINRNFVRKYHLKSSTKIEQLRIDYLKNECQILLTKINSHQESTKAINKRIISKNESIKTYKEKINRVKDMIKKSEKEKNKKENGYVDSNSSLNNIKTSIIELQKQRFIELNKYVFNLIEINPKPDDDIQKSTFTALKDARMTTFINGRWIKTNDPTFYQLVQSKLPSNGDYYCYIKKSDIKDNELSTDSLINYLSKQEIMSALTYTTQFVNLIAYFVNATLPYNLTHRKFCFDKIEENDFLNLVAKLNVNIIYLCIHQAIPIGNLLPKNTLENLYQFLKYVREMNTKARPKYKIEYPSEIIPLLEEMFADNRIDYSDFETIPVLSFQDNEEWETIPNSNEIPMDSTNPALTSPNRLISSSTSLISSFTSFFSRRLGGGGGGNTTHNTSSTISSRSTFNAQ